MALLKGQVSPAHLGAHAEVAAFAEEKRIGAATCDGAGWFVIEVPDDVPWPIELAALGQRVAVGEREATRDILIEVADETGPDTVLSMPHGDTPIVAPDDLALLNDLLREAAGQGLLDPELVGWADSAIDRLAQLERLAVDGILTVNRLSAFARLLGAEAAYNLAQRPDPMAEGGFGCGVQLRKPYAPVYAGMLLDDRDDRDGGEWTGRAVSFYVRHAEALTRALHGAHAVAAGEWELESFARTIPELAGAAGPFGGIPLPDLFPRPFPFPQREPPLTFDVCQLEWLNCAGLMHGARPPRPENPPTLARSEPDAVCAGDVTEITVYPPAGEPFGPVPPKSPITVGNVVARILAWSDTEARVEVPATVPPGCRPLGWLIDTKEQADAINGIRGACEAFFGPRPEVPPMRFRNDTTLTVVGTPATSITANGVAGQLNAEACRDVVIAWSVDPKFCAGTKDATLRVEVVDDLGNVVVSPAMRTGQATVRTSQARTYTVNAYAEVGGAPCHEGSAAVAVTRYAQVRLAAASSVEVGSNLAVTVSISCPAPAGGVAVTLTSSAGQRIATRQVTVPAGATSATVALPALACGDVVLTATAAGHLPATANVLVTSAPHLDAVTPSTATACTTFTVSATVRCTPKGTTLALERAGALVQLTNQRRVDSDPKNSYAGPTTLTADASGLLPGDYTVVVQAGSRTVRSTTPISVTVGKPTVGVSASPGNVSTCVPTRVTITVTATNATSMSLTRDDGSEVGSRTRPMACGTWTETFTDVRAHTTEYKAEVTGPAGDTATGTVTIVESTVLLQVNSVIVYNGHTSTRYVWKGIWSPAPALARIDRIGAVAPGGTITVDLDECEFADIRATVKDSAADAANSPNQQTNLMLGRDSAASRYLNL